MIIDPTQFATGASSGEMPGDAVAELQKALTAGYGTDPAGFTGGSALRIQSLDRTMFTTIQENEHFKLFNKLAKPSAGATVDEWTEQNSIGGFLGGSTNTETGNIADATGNYARRVGMVKYLMTRRQVSFVATLGNNIASAEAVENQNGALQLLTDAEYLAFEGDSTVVPTEFDGIFGQMLAGVAAGLVDNRNVLDARGNSVTSVNLFNTAAAQIAGYGNFGKPTDFFCSLDVQADMDTGLDPAFRVPLTDVPGGGISLGAPVVGIRTSHGNIANMPDVFVRGEGMKLPFQVNYAAMATAQDVIKPATITAVAGAGGVTSQWTAPQAGNYYFAAAGVNAAGQSTLLVSSQVAVAAGQAVTVTITQSGTVSETGYVIYRSRLNGGNAVTAVATIGSEFREMVRVPRNTGGTTTVYVDSNQAIPGTSNAYILSMLPSAGAITWRQLLPMLKFPLYPTQSAVIPWAQLLFGYLRLAKRKQHAVIRNIVSNTQVWRPFN